MKEEEFRIRLVMVEGDSFGYSFSFFAFLSLFRIWKPGFVLFSFGFLYYYILDFLFLFFFYYSRYFLFFLFYILHDLTLKFCYCCNYSEGGIISFICSHLNFLFLFTIPSLSLSSKKKKKNKFCT